MNLNCRLCHTSIPRKRRGNHKQTNILRCRHDIGGGRSEADLVSAKTSNFGKTFDSICYTADGEAVIAGKIIFLKVNQVQN